MRARKILPLNKAELNPRNVLNAVVLGMMFIALSACSRSAAYKKESQYTNEQTVVDREETVTQTKKFAAPKKRTLVLPFWNDTPIRGKFSKYSQRAIKDLLKAEGMINLVDDYRLPQKSQDFYLNKDKVNIEELAKIGRKWAVSLIVLGRISEIIFRKADEDVGMLRPSASRAAANVEVRLIDVASAKEAVVAQTVGTGKSNSLTLFGDDADTNREAREEIVNLAIDDGLKRAMPMLMHEIERITWRGRIAKVIGGKIYINAGRATGLNLGDILKVTTAGADIYDPETGIFLGRTEGEIKGTLEIVDYFGEDGAVSRIHAGGNFQENDIVQLYP